MTRLTRRAMLASTAGLFLPSASLWADEPKVDVQENIRKGLEWLAKNQNRTEGSWEAHGGQYPTTMTGLAGMAMLMEGSTIREGKYADVPKPDLVLLDLNLPKMDGRQVLETIKGDPVLRRIPVIVLTSSEAESDIARSYDLHANCYMCKPVDLNQFLETVRQIEEFWLTVVRLPPGRT